MKSLLTFLVSCLLTLTVAQPVTIQQEQRDSITSRVPSVDSIEVCIPFSAGWNMVSNPVLRGPGTDSIWQVFCLPQGSCFSYRFSYGSGYVQSCIAENGRGFWIKRQTPTTCCITGEAIAQDTIPVSPQWNLIGTISYPVPASSVYSIPPNIIVSSFFGYSSGYVRADTLWPGLGYWVRTTQAGLLVLSSGSQLGSLPPSAGTR